MTIFVLVADILNESANYRYWLIFIFFHDRERIKEFKSVLLVEIDAKLDFIELKLDFSGGISSGSYREFSAWQLL